VSGDVETDSLLRVGAVRRVRGPAAKAARADVAVSHRGKPIDSVRGSRSFQVPAHDAFVPTQTKSPDDPAQSNPSRPTRRP
jgi:hypothetical protein